MASVNPATIKEANEAVKSVTSEGKSKWRGSFAKFSPEQQAAIGKYASLHGNQAAIRPSLIEPGCDLFVCTWNISKWGSPNRPAIERTRARAVDHAKFKTTKIYSQGILVNHTKICTNENFPLYGMLKIGPIFLS